MAELKAIRNHIIFKFVDGFSNRDVRQFADKTDWGFEIVRHNESMESPRLVDVVAVGHEVPNDIRPGLRVLVEPLKWTDSFKFGDEEYWRTDSDHILAIDESVVPA